MFFFKTYYLTVNISKLTEIFLKKVIDFEDFSTASSLNHQTNSSTAFAIITSYQKQTTKKYFVNQSELLIVI